MREVEVIVIGAGAAGLAAAGMLDAAGVRVLVVEGRDRIGGRILTLRDTEWNLPIELGAEFIHGRPEQVLSLVQELKIPIYDLPFIHRRKKGRRLAPFDFGETLERVMSGLTRIGRRDMSFAEYLRRYRSGWRYRDARKMAIAFVQGFDAADPDRISARSLAEEMEGIGDLEGQTQFRLATGYGALIEAMRASLSSRVRIRLSTVVESVQWGRGEAQVVCRASGRKTLFRASKVVVTLPLGVLQAPADAPGAVRFEPEVVAQRSAVARLGFGAVVKVVCQFSEPFWEHAETARAVRSDERLRDAVFLHHPDAPFPTWWTSRPLHVPFLTAWAGGPKADALRPLSESVVVDLAIESLASIFNQRVRSMRNLVERTWMYDWGRDPFSRGAYGYVAVGGESAREVLAAPVAETLYFAGEATDTSGEASTVAGAIASGKRAAERVLRATGRGRAKPLLRRQSP